MICNIVSKIDFSFPVSLFFFFFFFFFGGVGFMTCFSLINMTFAVDSPIIMTFAVDFLITMTFEPSPLTSQ